jgi:16S rRNA (cytosine1402-N4)-methyltransferase
MTSEHTAVLVEEALAALAVEAGGYYVDATFGRGGHTARLLEALGREGRVLAIDQDPQAIQAGRARFADEMRVALVHASFAELGSLVPAYGDGRACRGVLFDLGVSSPQLDDPARGFSFRADGPLDMRMDTSRGEPVSGWLARASVDEIREVIADLGEERFARRVANTIVAARREHPVLRTSELAALVSRAVRTREPGKHPATRTFQALRIFINNELGALESALGAALQLLAPGSHQLSFARRPLGEAFHAARFHSRCRARPSARRPAGGTADAAHRRQEVAAAGCGSRAQSARAQRLDARGREARMKPSYS